MNAQENGKMMQGKIIKGIAGFYYVHIAQKGICECKAKGVFRNQNIKPMVGDNVEVDILDEENLTGNITRIMERKNSLIRPVVANIDQALVVFALKDPKPNFNLLDRFLVMMERQDIPCVLCLNKMDLEEEKEIKFIEQLYQKAGYMVLCTSTKENRGLEQVRDYLKGKTTALAGPSGVGKSSMLNAIFCEEKAQTGQVSEKIGRGKHTTRHTEIFSLGEDTYLMDTPGFSSLYTDEQMEKEDLKSYYPEFWSYEGKCRFLGCVHVDEPDCAVKDAVQSGAIGESRYENYKLMFQEIKAKKNDWGRRR